MPDFEILATFVASFMPMIVGFVWYAKPVFGGMWMDMVGLDQQKIDKMSGLPMIVIFLSTYLASLLNALVLGVLLNQLGPESLKWSMIYTLLIWMGLVAATSLPSYMFEQRPLRLFLINSGKDLASFLLMGIAFGVL